MSLLKEPIGLAPLKDKDIVAPGMGLKLLSGSSEEYSWAVTVTVVPKSCAATDKLKKAVMLVMTPSRGNEKAMSSNCPAAPARFMVSPPPETPETEDPKPTSAEVPIRPPAIVVTETGVPEANGMIGPAPAPPIGANRWNFVS